MTLDKALTVIATRWNGQERWIAAISMDQGVSIRRTRVEEQPDSGQEVYRIDRDSPPIPFAAARVFDDWQCDWNEGDEVWS
jgi:hypothetical protein